VLAPRRSICVNYSRLEMPWRCGAGWDEPRRLLHGKIEDLEA
jgi:hypothetical protein